MHHVSPVGVVEAVGGLANEGRGPLAIQRPLVAHQPLEIEALDDADLPRKPARPPGAEREAIVSCLSVLVGAIAAENELPPGLLTPRAALERVARELPATAEAVARTLEAGEWRAALVAEPLRALLAGEIALTVGGAKSGSPHVDRVAQQGRGGVQAG